MTEYQSVDYKAVVELLEAGWEMLQAEERAHQDPAANDAMYAQTVERWNRLLRVIRAEFDAGAVIEVLVDILLVSYRNDVWGVERNLEVMRSEVASHIEHDRRPADPTACPSVPEECRP